MLTRGASKGDEVSSEIFFVVVANLPESFSRWDVANLPLKVCLHEQWKPCHATTIGLFLIGVARQGFHYSCKYPISQEQNSITSCAVGCAGIPFKSELILRPSYFDLLGTVWNRWEVFCRNLRTGSETSSNLYISSVWERGVWPKTQKMFWTTKLACDFSSVENKYINDKFEIKLIQI
jgi:hypothetical protein